MKKQRFTIILLFHMIALPVVGKAQLSLPNSGNHVVCQFSSQPYGVDKVDNNTYEWTIIPIDGGNGIIQDANANPISIYWESAGTCTLQLVETNDLGCSITVSITVTVTPTPVLTITNPPASCSTVDLTAATITTGSQLPQSTNLTYWTDELATTELTEPQFVDVSGTYYIKALSGEGCYDIMPVVVVINPAPIPDIAGSSIACSGDTEIYGVPQNAANTYTWTVSGGNIVSGQNSNEIAVKWTGSTGVVSVTELSSNCTSNASKDVTINPVPTTLTIFHN